ncbi:MarR family winged helix-turn-helix transcriptional regulator [Mycolicibacter hiberniae]|uniref:Putative HTH-type transcriptional regulator n=1 Tax=Mycolicibacter hiberniae TaxID=29314 RepID=A0A7I7X4J3_9MYCO|nr:MarR family transcriptional regulator [Mycolicibacter hiberniae]MCV7087892.1 MarR family transcriptional regulator [Mycolicibacter hiberniae]ORV66297.1 transcriptional regulator [Mycolicibacter hiberniae]BBZ23631.1 putative HTH-type transcriptional regulator [Mycolicibacter hiberniae]
MIDVDSAPLGYLLYRASSALRPQVTAVLGPLGLTLPEFACMRMLSLRPGLSSAELARHAGVTPQAMNTVLHRLENRGAVSRPDSVPFGRALPATLTEAGQDLLTEAQQAVRVADGRVLAALSTSEQHRLREMLERIGAECSPG